MFPVRTILRLPDRHGRRHRMLGMRDLPFLRLRRLLEQRRSGVRGSLRKPSLAVVVNLIAWVVSTAGTPGRALALPSALGVLLSMSAAAQGLTAPDKPASVAGPPIGSTMMWVVPHPAEMYAVPDIAPAVPYASCYRIGRCSASALYRFRDRPNRLTRLAPEAPPESVAGPALLPRPWFLVPVTPEENILPQYRAASQVRDEYRAVGRPLDGPN
jgi:hypothetical protein